MRRFRVETAKILLKEGKIVEAPHVLREISTYDPRGRKIDGVAYPVEGSTLPGKEQYQYDDKGNIVEMTLRADDGSILSKEKYDYEFDEFGNWKKMTSSVGIYESGKLSYEPVEVTYRMITYYYNQAIDKVAPSLSKAGEGSGSTSRAGLPASEPAKAPAPASPTEAKPTIKDEVSSSRVDAKVKKSEIKDTTSAAAAQRDNATIENSHKGTPVAAPTGSSLAASTPASLARLPINNDRSTTGDAPSHSALSASVVPPGATPSVPVVSSYQKGLTYLADGRHAEAAQALKQAVQQNPNDAMAYMKLGLAYSGLLQYREAITALKMAISIKPEVVDAEEYYQLGQAYASLGKHSEALKALTQALYITRAQAIDPEGAKGQRLQFEQIRYGLGLTYYKVGRYKDAITELKQVIKLNPKNAEGYYALALAYIAIGDQASAENQQKLLRALNPELANKIAQALDIPPVRCSYITGCR